MLVLRELSLPTEVGTKVSTSCGRLELFLVLNYFNLLGEGNGYRMFGLVVVTPLVGECFQEVGKNENIAVS